MEGYAVRYEGLTDLLKALRELEPVVLRELKQAFGQIAEHVTRDARLRFRRYNEQSAYGFAGSVRQSGLVVVQQTRRKTTGLRPDFGALMMRKALLPARASKMEETVRVSENAVNAALKATGF